MTSSGTEKRRKTDLLGLRLEPETYERLSSAAAARRMTPTAWARNIIEQHLDGSRVARSVDARTLAISADDRSLLGTFARSSGHLAGALIQSARLERTLRGTTGHHARIEELLIATREVKAILDAIMRRLEP